MILKTIRASIRLSSKLSLVQFINRGLVSTEHPHHFKLYPEHYLAGLEVPTKLLQNKNILSLFFIKSTQFAVDPPIIQSFFGSIWRDLYIIK